MNTINAADYERDYTIFREEFDYLEIPSVTTEQYRKVIGQIMDELPTNDSASLDHIKYTLAHKLAIMALSYEYLGHVSKRLLLHDTEKLVLYTMMNTRKAHDLHRMNSVHHHEVFSADTAAASMDSYTEAVLDYECARYTKPDKPLNAYATIKRYYADDFMAQEPILELLGICSPENHDCDFKKWDQVASFFLPAFVEVNILAIRQLKPKFADGNLQTHMAAFNQYLSDLWI